MTMKNLPWMQLVGIPLEGKLHEYQPYFWGSNGNFRVVNQRGKIKGIINRNH
jgi:hypothetical protein